MNTTTKINKPDLFYDYKKEIKEIEAQFDKVRHHTDSRLKIAHYKGFEIRLNKFDCGMIHTSCRTLMSYKMDSLLWSIDDYLYRVSIGKIKDWRKK